MRNMFYLKYRDTRPTLEVVLKDPDGAVHDLTGATSTKLYISLENGATLFRTMSIFGAPTNGTLRYSWQTSDWNPANLVVGTHKMEYEVISPAGTLTFPNDGFDALKIVPDIL